MNLLGQVVFDAQQLTKRFSSRGHRFQMGPIDLELRTGEITGLVGENGNGKTTLLRQVAGLLDHNEGTARYPLLGDDPYLIKQGIAWIPQRSVRWYGTLMQNLRFVAAVHGINGADNEDRVNYTLHRLGLTRFQHLRWSQLSSGYKLRFELAKMVVWRPRILVLDEPIANLDLQAQQLFLQDLKFLAASQRNPISVILSSQQLHEIEAIADNIIFLKNGKPMFSGAVASFDQDRASNVFEIKGEFDRTRLVQALGSERIVHLDDTGLIFRLTTPREITAKHGTLLIFDEVVSGFGRLGHWWGAQRYQVTPDLMCFAKGATSGYLPLGGVLTSEKVNAVLEADDTRMLRHGFTYSGHPTVCAAALANLAIIEDEGLLERAVRIGDRLGPALGALVDEGLASELRGTDGVWALGLGDGVAPAAVRDHMLAAGVIPRPIPAATVAFCPPLVIGDDDLDLIVDATRKALADLAEAQA